MMLHCNGLSGLQKYESLGEEVQKCYGVLRRICIVCNIAGGGTLAASPLSFLSGPFDHYCLFRHLACDTIALPLFLQRGS